eukprot:gene361-2413_t
MSVDRPSSQTPGQAKKGSKGLEAPLSPPALCCASATAVGSKVYLFGGNDNKQLFQDIYVLDTATANWSMPKVVGNKPPKRSSHSAVAVGQGIVIFGGRGESPKEAQGKDKDAAIQATVLGDVHYFHVDTADHWTPLKTIGNVPPFRMGHTASLLRDMMYIYGGLDGSGRWLQDLHVLTFPDDKNPAFAPCFWQAVSVTSPPPPCPTYMVHSGSRLDLICFSTEDGVQVVTADCDLHSHSALDVLSFAHAYWFQVTRVVHQPLHSCISHTDSSDSLHPDLAARWTSTQLDMAHPAAYLFPKALALHRSWDVLGHAHIRACALLCMDFTTIDRMDPGWLPLLEDTGAGDTAGLRLPSSVRLAVLVLFHCIAKQAGNYAPLSGHPPDPDALGAARSLMLSPGLSDLDPAPRLFVCAALSCYPGAPADEAEVCIAQLASLAEVDPDEEGIHGQLLAQLARQKLSEAQSCAGSAQICHRGRGYSVAADRSTGRLLRK